MSDLVILGHLVWEKPLIEDDDLPFLAYGIRLISSTPGGLYEYNAAGKVWTKAKNIHGGLYEKLDVGNNEINILFTPKENWHTEVWLYDVRDPDYPISKVISLDFKIPEEGAIPVNKLHPGVTIASLLREREQKKEVMLKQI